jgi:hypothetical protein
VIREYHDPSFSSFDMLGIGFGPTKPRAPKRKRAKKAAKTRKAANRRSK